MWSGQCPGAHWTQSPALRGAQQHWGLWDEGRLWTHHCPPLPALPLLLAPFARCVLGDRDPTARVWELQCPEVHRQPLSFAGGHRWAGGWHWSVLAECPPGASRGWHRRGFALGAPAASSAPSGLAPGGALGSPRSPRAAADTRLPAEPIVKQINSPLRRGIAVLSGRLGSGGEESSCSGTHSPFLFRLPGFSSM